MHIHKEAYRYRTRSIYAALTGGQASPDLADPTKTPSLARVIEETCNAPGHYTVQEWPHYPTQSGIYSLTQIARRPRFALLTRGCSTLRKVESTLTATHSVETTLCVAHAPAA